MAQLTDHPVIRVILEQSKLPATDSGGDLWKAVISIAP
jgi:hypothetical protein